MIARLGGAAIIASTLFVVGITLMIGVAPEQWLYDKFVDRQRIMEREE